jgi:hypothetical protein
MLYMSVHGVACRFERMIVALSTHALFANTAELLNISASDISVALVRILIIASFSLTDLS